MNEYQFTTTDMTDGLRELSSLFYKFLGEPINCLEIGVWEGCSACWLLDTILTHPQARYTGVDLYEGSYEIRYITAMNNLSKHPSKTRLFRGDSSSILLSCMTLESALTSSMSMDAIATQSVRMIYRTVGSYSRMAESCWWMITTETTTE